MRNTIVAKSPPESDTGCPLSAAFYLDMALSDSTTRFSDRVDNYFKYRPSYPHPNRLP